MYVCTYKCIKHTYSEKIIISFIQFANCFTGIFIVFFTSYSLKNTNKNYLQQITKRREGMKIIKNNHKINLNK